FLFQIFNAFILGVYSKPEDYLNELIKYSKSQEKLSRKVCIITGATSGIGLETAKTLYKAGYLVILGTRNAEKTQELIETITDENSEGDLIHIPLDCNTLVSCKQFIQKFKSLNLKLDLLINNAGIMMVPYDETIEFLETQIGINYISHFYLTNQLIPHFNKNSKIINLSSIAAYYSNNIDLEQITKTQFYHPVLNYSQSKLANLLHTYYLQKELKDKEIYVYAVHPGMVSTNLYQFDTMANFFNKYFNFLFKTPIAGSFTVLRCAILPPSEGHFDSSLYYAEEQTLPTHKAALDGKSIPDLINWTIETIEDRGYTLLKFDD
ncbi:NAD(P)-binding protein, partial [Conidiobolus coronatus NRRL 28638]